MHSLAVPPKVDWPLGGTLPRERERNRKRQRDTGSREEKQKISRCTDMGLVPVVNFICQDVGVPPEGPKDNGGTHM